MKKSPTEDAGSKTVNLLYVLHRDQPKPATDWQHCGVRIGIWIRLRDGLTGAKYCRSLPTA
jgi:hypothetical protein